MEDIYEYPLKQHLGEQVVPVVVDGDSVNRGQLVAFQRENTLGANLYSSVKGVVTKVTEQSIFIKAVGEQTADYEPLKGSEPLELIREAGLVGLGGAGFPTYAKLSKPFEHGGTVIINAAECEPILSHNIERIRQKPEQLLRGLRIAMDVVHATKGVIAIKEKHTEAVKALREANKDPDISLTLLEDMYPMGEERAIIREVLGKLLKVTDLPLAADAIVTNAETACRIQEAVDEHKPFIDKDMTVAGKIAGNEQDKLIQVFLDVPLGTKVSAMFEKAGGLGDSYHGRTVYRETDIA